MKMKLKVIRQIIREETARLMNEKRTVSPELNKLVGFASVFANIPRQIRLDVLRVIEGDYESVDPENIRKSLDVLHGLDDGLDQALEDYVDSFDEKK